MAEGNREDVPASRFAATQGGTMKQHRHRGRPSGTFFGGIARRFQAGLLAVAAVLAATILVGVASVELAQAEPTDMTAQEPVAPASLPDAADAHGPLTWSPLGFAPMADKAYDLCDDDAAVIAGLDGGALTEDRASLGIDCTRAASPNRFGYLASSGALALGTTPDDARAAAADIGGDGIEKPAEETAQRMLGFFGRGAPDAPDVDSVQIIPDSLSLEDGVVRGLVYNTSAELFATDVTVSVKGIPAGVSWRVPLTVQPGETAPFQIRGLGDIRPLGVDDLAVDSRLSDNVDVERSVLVTGSPGAWYGTAHDFPGLKGLVAELPQGEFEYFETLLEVAEPTSHPSLAAEVRALVIEKPTAYVAFFDEEGSVLGVAELEVRKYDGRDGTVEAANASFGETYVVGFIIPNDAADFAMWIGGSR